MSDSLDTPTGEEVDLKNEPVQANKLELLESHKDFFQVEVFYKALNKQRKDKDSGNPSAILSVEDMLTYSPDPIPTSLLKLSKDYAVRSVKMFVSILKYMGLTSDDFSEQQKVETVQKVLHQGLKRPELKDELYMQLIKQTRSNPSLDAKLKAWELFHVVTSTMPPSKEFIGLVSEHIELVSHGDSEEQTVIEIASKSWISMKRSLKAGSRKTLPTTEELTSLISDKKLTCIVFFLDETFEEIAYDITTTVSESIKQLADIITLQNFDTFTLFDCRKVTGIRTDLDSLDEHIMLDDNSHIADVLFDFRKSMNSREGIQSKLLMKKKMFRVTDEKITEKHFVILCYLQIQYDYLQGCYPVDKEDAALLCALQAQQEYGSWIFDNETELAQCIDKWIPKQSLKDYPPEEWLQLVKARAALINQISKEEARLQFLRIFQSLPYGNSMFFSVTKQQDPLGLLPRTVILGVNKRGIHFFRPSPKEYLHSAEWRDIMQFGSSNQAVFFKIRVTGVLHIFQFETRQGEDICLALQTHINDIMLKRIQKTNEKNPQPSASSQNEGSAGESSSNASRPADSGPQENANQLQKILEEKSKIVEELQKRLEELKVEHRTIEGKIAEEKESEKALKQAIESLNETNDALQYQKYTLAQLTSEFTEKLEAAKASAKTEAERDTEESEMIKKLNQQRRETTEKLQSAQQRCRELDDEFESSKDRKRMKDIRIQRLKIVLETETSELLQRQDAVKAHMSNTLTEEEHKISMLTEEYSHMTEMYSRNKVELEKLELDYERLEELENEEQEIESRRNHFTGVISDQKKSIKELEARHSEAILLRKECSAMLEALRGQIRVCVRLAPTAPEQDRSILRIIDDDTLAFVEDVCKESDFVDIDENYFFGEVFDSQCTNERVSREAKNIAMGSLEGFNISVVAYGMSGSGKTMTMFGKDDDEGIIVRTVKELLKECQERADDLEYTIESNMVQLYEDELTDLLESTEKKLVLKKDHKGLVHVINSHFVPLTTADILKETIDAGFQKQSDLDADSSLAHVVVTVNITCINRKTEVRKYGRIVFADLAGNDSDDPSLESLRDVVEGLEDLKQKIPYTASNLTALLSDTFGGNSKTLVLVHVKPEETLFDETRETLDLALSFQKVQNFPVKIEITREAFEIKKQINEVKLQLGIPKELLEAVDMKSITDEGQDHKLVKKRRHVNVVCQ